MTPRHHFGDSPGEIDSCSLALALRRREEARLRLEQIARETAQRRSERMRKFRALLRPLRAVK